MSESVFSSLDTLHVMNNTVARYEVDLLREIDPYDPKTRIERLRNIIPNTSRLQSFQVSSPVYILRGKDVVEEELHEVECTTLSSRNYPTILLVKMGIASRRLGSFPVFLTPDTNDMWSLALVSPDIDQEEPLLQQRMDPLFNINRDSEVIPVGRFSANATEAVLFQEIMSAFEQAAAING